MITFMMMMMMILMISKQKGEKFATIHTEKHFKYMLNYVLYLIHKIKTNILPWKLLHQTVTTQ